MKICLVCADGGHLTEMIQLMAAFNTYDIFFITYTGTRSEELSKNYKVYSIPNIIGHFFGFITSYPKLLMILLNERPDVIISTGSEIAIPVFYFGSILGIKKVYIETLTRINKPSFTGKLVYPISDVFLVQWKQLLEKYGKKAQYWGSVF